MRNYLSIVSRITDSVTALKDVWYLLLAIISHYFIPEFPPTNIFTHN